MSRLFFTNLDNKSPIEFRERSSMMEIEKRMIKYKVEDQMLDEDVEGFTQDTVFFNYH